MLLADALLGFPCDEFRIFLEGGKVAGTECEGDLHAELLALPAELLRDRALHVGIRLDAFIEKTHHVGDGDDAGLQVLRDDLDSTVFTAKDICDGHPGRRHHLGRFDACCAGPGGALEESHEVALCFALRSDAVRDADALEKCEALARVIAGLSHELTTRDALEGQLVGSDLSEIVRALDDIFVLAAAAKALEASLFTLALRDAFAEEHRSDVLVETGDESAADARVRIGIHAIFVELLSMDHGGLLVGKVHAVEITAAAIIT